MIDISEAQYAQGDVVRATQVIVRNKLTLDSVGASECKRLIIECGEGNRSLWKNPFYLRQTIHLAQEIIREVRAAL